MKTNLTKTGYCLFAALLLTVSHSNNANAAINSKPGKVIATVKPPYVALSFLRAELLDLSVARINWVTQVEVNSDYFLIQKSTTGKAFPTSGEVNSAGNRNEPTAYSFIDNNSVKVITYYKILEVDKDGHTTDLGMDIVYPKTKR